MISKNENKNNLKRGVPQAVNLEIHDTYLDELIKTNSLDRLNGTRNANCLNDKTVRSNTVQDLNDFNSQILSTQAKKEKQLFSMMPAIKKVFDLMGADIVELSAENEYLKNKIGCYDKKWLEESRAKLLK